MKYFVKVGDDDLSWGSQPKSTTTTKKIEQVPGTHFTFHPSKNCVILTCDRKTNDQIQFFASLQFRYSQKATKN